MESDEERRQEQLSMSLYHATKITDLLIEKGAQNLYDKYLDSILPPHEIFTVMSSVKHVVHHFFREKDLGESKQDLENAWNQDHEEEPPTSSVCHWANGNINIEKALVFSYNDTESEEPVVKTGPKSTTSFQRKKNKPLSYTKKSFKEFKPKPKPLEDTEKMHPKLLRARKLEKELHEQENK